MKKVIIGFILIVLAVIVAFYFLNSNSNIIILDEQNKDNTTNENNQVEQPIINNSGNESLPTNIIKTCKDYDGGKNYYGGSKVIADGIYYNDSCVNDNTVLEYYCEGTINNWKVSSTEYNCPATCKKNACLE